MFVHLRQYRQDEAKETVRSRGDVSPDKDTDDYFGEDELDVDSWERVTRDGETLLRRAVSIDGVAAVSRPKDGTEEDEEVPGTTPQIRKDGGERYVEHAELVEAVDEDP